MKSTRPVFIFQMLLVILFLAVPAIVNAQGPGDPGGEPTPIDGGLSLLLAAGVGYGAKKINDNRKRNNN
jgi:hypothetical protein